MSTILNSRVFIWDWTRIYDVIDIKIPIVSRPHEITKSVGSKKMHSGKRFQNMRFTGFVWTEGCFAEKKRTRFRKYPDLCGRDLCIQTAASLLGFYCNKKPVHSQLYVSCSQLNLSSSRLSQKSLKSFAVIAAKKEVSDLVDHSKCGDKNRAKISVYIWITGICNNRKQTKRYQFVNDVGGPVKKSEHNSDGHLKHVSVSSCPLFLGVGWLFTWMGLLFKFDQDDGVKCNQQDRDENKYGGNCIAVNIEGLLRLTHPRLHFFFFLYHFFCVFCVLRKQHAWPKQVMWCNTTLQIIFLPRKEGCHNTLTLLGWSYIRQEFQYIWDEPLIHLQWALFVYQMCHLWCRTRFHFGPLLLFTSVNDISHVSQGNRWRP